MAPSETFQSWLLAPVLAQLGAITTQLNRIEQKVNKMADVLDTVLSDMNTAVSDLSVLMTNVATIIQDLQNEASGQVSVNDPRWATLTSAITQADSNIQTLSTNIQNAITPPPAPSGM